jgi:ribosome-binding protein aMBF1 (putative translation factor)
VSKERDFLDEMVAERTARNPDFPELLDAARRRRELLRALAAQRTERKISQTQLAAAMRTSQSTLARLETTAADTKLSTVERYAHALGMSVQYHLIDGEQGAREPGVVVHR